MFKVGDSLISMGKKFQNFATWSENNLSPINFNFVFGSFRRNQRRFSPFGYYVQNIICASRLQLPFDDII